ncbi:MAG: MAPEG family protein [Alphaproteobacteria bacterium]|nr:MAPEG family protein [Alphaproteobacteria bacterium]
MAPMILPSLVTGLALLLYLVVTANAARMRGRHRIMAPATSGHPAYERAFRVQQNTLEQIVLFLPALWLYSVYVSDRTGSVIGAVWILARLFYAWSYYRDPARRAPGFIIAAFASVFLLVGGLGGLIAAVP